MIPVVIKDYKVNPRATVENVALEFEYEVVDPIKQVPLLQHHYASLTDGEGPLADPKWGNDELAAALAAQLGIEASWVSVAVPSAE
jgi:hypothetical protein